MSIQKIFFKNIFISLLLVSILPISAKSQSPEIQAGFEFTQPGFYMIEGNITQQEWDGPSPSHYWRGKIWTNQV